MELCLKVHEALMFWWCTRNAGKVHGVSSAQVAVGTSSHPLHLIHFTHTK